MDNTATKDISEELEKEIEEGVQNESKRASQVPNIPVNAPLKIEEEKRDNQNELAVPEEKNDKKIFFLGIAAAALVVVFVGLIFLLFITSGY